jgi:hypothetical protein
MTTTRRRRATSSPARWARWTIPLSRRILARPGLRARREAYMIAGTHAVLWVRQDRPGNDACRFAEAEGGFLIDGSATDEGWKVTRYRVRAREDGTRQPADV